MVKMIPLYKPYIPENLPELNEILYSGSLSYGKWGNAFERQLEDYLGTGKIAVVNSFNSAMLVTLTTMGIKAGDSVIASPVSCLASNQPFATLGITVIWADIDPETGTLCPESVRSKLTNKTKAIFHNHFCGYPGYVDEINEIGKEKGLFIVDDAIEAFGSEYKNRKIGNTGSDATVFSFQTVRLPNTIDGGAISFKDSNHFEKAKRIRDYGIDRRFFRDSLGEISIESDISEPGYGALLSEMNSYIGCQQMEKLPGLLETQRKNAEAWIDFCRANDIRTMERTFQSPNYWIFGILAPNKNKAIKQFRELGYYASGVHLPNSNYSVFGKQDKLPGVDDFYARFVALPCGWWFSR